ncbi:MAG: hypothetical protein WBB07_17485 [Mycobacterium sp.]
MPWFYVDDMFADSKPVMALDRALRNEAIGLWVRCGAWSAKEETDGRVPLDTVKSFGGTPRLIRALHQQANLWGHENPEIPPESWRDSREILFKSWEKWQKTRAENAAKREADAARQSSYRKGKKGRNYVPPKATSSDDAEVSQRDSDESESADSKFVSRCESQRPDPDPTRPNPSLVETSQEGVTSGDAREAPPKCRRHKENSPSPCPACKARRKWDEAEADRQKADEVATRRRRREAIDLCDLCDRNGKRDFGSFMGTCAHPDNPPELQEASNA